MKKLFTILVLNVLWFNTSFADIGMGKISLSDSVIRSFQEYISSRQNKPVKFLVTEDGKDSWGWYCPYSSCQPTGSAQEEKLCFNRFGRKCSTLAFGRTVRWKNEITKKANLSDKRFSSKDDFATIKEKLTKLGLVGHESELNINIEKKKETKRDEDIVKKIKDLNDLYKSGALTKEEFTKAKKKLLN